MAPKYKFDDGEKVLCFHGPLLYEAKCIKAQVKEKIVKYYLHYSGWNKNWDEWVPETRVLKYNDANIQKQKELLTIHGSSKKVKPAKNSSKKDITDRESSELTDREKTPKQKNKEATATSAPSTSETTAELQRRRKKAEQNVKTEEIYTQKSEIKLEIPDELKRWIVDDWFFISRKGKLLKLPARVSVETILSDYMKHRLSSKFMTCNKETRILETVNGIRQYFNAMLGIQLLFKLEKAQYKEVMSENPGSTPSMIYGAFHLLRLFTKLNSAIGYTELDEDGSMLLTTTFSEFLEYMSKCSANLFNVNDYESVSSDTEEQEVKSEEEVKSEDEPASPEHKKKHITKEVKSEDKPASPEQPSKKKHIKNKVKSEDE